MELKCGLQIICKTKIDIKRIQRDEFVLEMTKILLAIIITIVLSQFNMNNFSVKGISVLSSPFIHPTAKIGIFGKNLSNQRMKLNEESCMDIELKTFIKILKQMKKRLAKCEKHKSHTNLIGNLSPDLTFVHEI